MCDVVSQSSRHSQLCWTIWLQIKLKHNHLHLMASIRWYLISSKLFTSLLIMSTLSLTGVSSTIYANRLVLLCRKSPWVPTESWLCRKTPDRTDTVGYSDAIILLWISGNGIFNVNNVECDECTLKKTNDIQSKLFFHRHTWFVFKASLGF